MAETKFKNFVENLKKGNLEGVKKNFEYEFMEKNIDNDSDLNWRPIHLACRYDHIDIAKFLINQKCNIEIEDKDNRRPLHLACYGGHIKTVKLLIDEKCDIESEDKDKYRPIHFACRYSSVEIVKLLINQKCNIESDDKDKWRPIHVACRYASVEIVKLLIDQKCNIESEDIYNQRPLHLACYGSHIKTVKLLIDEKCNIDSEDIYKYRPIHFACRYVSVEIVKLLIDQKCNIESEDIYKWKPIHVACRYASVEIVKLLIDQKCNIESEDIYKWRPIHVACQYAHIEIVKLLIDQKCNIESEDKDKWRPIHFACFSGQLEKVKLLFAHRCKIEVRNRAGETPLEVTKSKGYNDIVKWIEEFIKNSEVCDSITNNDLEAFIKHCTSDTQLILDFTSETPWLEIVHDKRADKVIKFFIDQPINPLDIVTIRNVIDNDITQSLNYQLWEEVLLYKCIRDHNLRGFQLLCRPNVINRQRKIIPYSFLEATAEYGGYVFVDQILKNSLFHSESWKRAKAIALEKGHSDIAESISNRELLLRCRQKAGLSILHTAVCDNNPDMMEYILKDESLVDPNHNHEILGTALALAIVLCNEKCLSVLERFNVNCNTRNKYLQTPLHEAISNGMIDHCRYLIDCANCIDETGFMEQTALHCAVMRGCEDLCDELIKKGADCRRYMGFLQYSIQKKDSLPLNERENALTLCAKINKTIYPCFIESMDAIKANSCDDKGNSLIHLAVTLLNKDLCKSLIEKGGNVNSLNKRGNSPLFELFSQLDKDAFKKNEEKVIEVVNLFINAKCNINHRFRGNLTLFDISLKFDCERLLLALVPPLQQNQSLDIDEDLFEIALKKKYFRFCEALLESQPQGQLERCINIDKINIALQNNQQNLLKSLFIQSSLEVKESMIEQVLYYFAKLNEEDTFKSLLDIEIKSPGYLENGETLFTGLLIERKLNFCQKIIQSKKNNKKYINLQNKKNQTPLQVSIEMESMKMMQHLSFETIELDNEDIESRTALMQLFEKVSNIVDEDQSFGLMNAIKTIIHVGGNIYHKTQKGINIIEYCSQPEARQEIESYFLKLKQKKETVENEFEKDICEICKERKVDSIFDCGHTICTICSDKIVRCPFCGFEPVRPK